jgi:hypothetical protein
MISILKINFFFLVLGPTHPGSESSLDSCGLRFLLAARHHSYLLRFLPPIQRAALKKQGISSSLLTWAFHSEAQDELLQLLPAFTKRKEQLWLHEE